MFALDICSLVYQLGDQSERHLNAASAASHLYDLGHCHSAGFLTSKVFVIVSVKLFVQDENEIIYGINWMLNKKLLFTLPHLAPQTEYLKSFKYKMGSPLNVVTGENSLVFPRTVPKTTLSRKCIRPMTVAVVNIRITIFAYLYISQVLSEVLVEGASTIFLPLSSMTSLPPELLLTPTHGGNPFSSGTVTYLYPGDKDN